MKSLNKGVWVYHRYKKRLGFVLTASSTPLEPVGWVTVLFVGDDTPHDAYVNFLKKIEKDNNEKTNQRRLGLL